MPWARTPALPSIGLLRPPLSDPCTECGLNGDDLCLGSSAAEDVARTATVLHSLLSDRRRDAAFQSQLKSELTNARAAAAAASREQARLEERLASRERDHMNVMGRVSGCGGEGGWEREGFGVGGREGKTGEEGTEGQGGKGREMRHEGAAIW